MTASANKDPAISSLLAAHVRRPLGESGIRRATLTCLTDGREVVTYELTHAWRIDGDACSSLFRVHEGSPLSGTTILLIERPFAEATLWLSLRTAHRVRALGTSRIQDYVLGSDFVYDDFRMWTPRALTAATRCGPIAHDLGDTWFAGHSLWRGEPADVEGTMNGEHSMLVYAHWSVPGSLHPLRTLTVSDVRKLGGVATPSMMRVVRPVEGYESKLMLVRQETNVALPATLFTPTGMQAARDTLSNALRAAIIR